jgi:hypothetical protein
MTTTLEGGEGSASRPGHFTPRKDPVPIVQEAGWAPKPVWTGAKNLAPTGIRSPDRPAHSSVAIPTELPGSRMFIVVGGYFSCPCSPFHLPLIMYTSYSCFAYFYLPHFIILLFLIFVYIFPIYFTLVAGLLARNQYSDGPATDHLDTEFSCFPCVCKRMLRWFPRFQVATTCFSCGPPELNLVVINFIFCIHVN